MMIGRIAEKQSIISSFDSEYSEFVTVYGRRRVGKTFFVRETFGYKFTFEHAGLSNSSMKNQLEAWASSMRDKGMDDAKTPASWIDAFDQLKELIRTSTDAKKVVFIDEMPWMDTPRSGFIPALEHFWNGWASARKDVLLIVCGSATSWVINNLIKNHGGLHGRITNKIHIKPFTLNECEQYAKAKKLGMNRQMITEAYMVMGGIPYYWSYLDRGKSLSANIDQLFFSEEGPLHNEYYELYASLFKNPEPYQRVISVLGKKKSGLTREEISNDAKLKENGRLSTLLNDLEICGFIRKYNMFSCKSRNAIYQLTDPYTLFYFKFIQGNKNNDEHFWSHNLSSPVYYAWCGLAFERVCMDHLGQIKQALGISGVVTNTFSWRVGGDASNKGAQVDMVIDRADGIVDLCEMKYTRSSFVVEADYYEALQNKREMFAQTTKTDKALHLVAVSMKSVEQNMYSDIFQNIVTLDDLFC